MLPAFNYHYNGKDTSDTQMDTGDAAFSAGVFVQGR